jgi:DNA-binding NarL/FixJ family response regulator
MTIRTMVADDQTLVRAGFRKILEAEADIEVVGEAGDGVEAVEIARRFRPEIALLDIRMPRRDGIEAARQILDGPADGTRVIMLTTFGIDEYVFAALRAGASGFLLKDTPPDQLVDAVRLVAGGEALLSPQITRTVIERFVEQGRYDLVLRRRVDELTQREVEVLRLLTRGLSNAELARTLTVSEATVKTHIAGLLVKLGVRDRVQAVIAAYESGLVLPGAER